MLVSQESQSVSASSSLKDISLPETVNEHDVPGAAPFYPVPPPGAVRPDDLRHQVDREFGFLNERDRSHSSSEELLSHPASRSDSLERKVGQHFKPFIQFMNFFLS